MVDWQSESDLDSIRNSCDVFIEICNVSCWLSKCFQMAPPTAPDWYESIVWVLGPFRGLSKASKPKFICKRYFDYFDLIWPPCQPNFLNYKTWSGEIIFSIMASNRRRGWQNFEKINWRGACRDSFSRNFDIIWFFDYLMIIVISFTLADKKH